MTSSEDEHQEHQSKIKENQQKNLLSHKFLINCGFFYIVFVSLHVQISYTDNTSSQREQLHPAQSVTLFYKCNRNYFRSPRSNCLTPNSYVPSSPCLMMSPRKMAGAHLQAWSSLTSRGTECCFTARQSNLCIQSPLPPLGTAPPPRPLLMAPAVRVRGQMAHVLC